MAQTQRDTNPEATEFARRRNLPHVDVRRMFCGNPRRPIMDVILSHTGREIGWMTEIRGKRSYILPALPADLA